MSRAVWLAALLLFALRTCVRADAFAELRAQAAANGEGRVFWAPEPKPTDEPALADDWGLYFRGKKVCADDWKKHKAALDALTDKFLVDVLPPFVLPAGAVVVTGVDDIAYGPDRGSELRVELSAKEREKLNAWFPIPWPHEAIDVASRISFDSAKTLATVGDAAVYAIYPRGPITLRHGGLYIAQKVELRQGDYVLKLDIVYAHVTANAAPFRHDRPIGRLDGKVHWKSADPALTGLMAYKGNHVHLLIRGINDLESRHFVEWARSGRKDPDLIEYVQYRADFLNKRLLPKVTVSR